MYLLPQQIKLFEGLEDEELLKILDALPLRNYRRGLDVFQQGERSREVYGILRGKIEILHRPPKGDLQRIALLEAGDFFGEFSYLTGDARSSSALAVEDSVLIEVSENWLKGNADRFESLQKRLVEMYRARVLSNVLRRTKLFSILDREGLAKLGSRFRYRRLEAGAEIMHEGQASAELVILKSGKLRVTKKKGTKEIELGEIEAGEVVGEMALITGKRRSATVTSTQKSEIMILDAEKFQASIKEYPALYRRLREIIEFRAAKTREILDALANELAPGVAAEAENLGGLRVDDLNLALKVSSGDQSLKLQLQQISSQNLLVGSEVPISLSDGSEVNWTISRPKKKVLERLRDVGELNGVRFSKSPEIAEIKLDLSLRSKIVPMIQLMAKAKLQGLVYPEYPVEDESVRAEVLLESGPKAMKILAVSQTGMRLSGKASWFEGQIYPLKLFRGEKEIFEIPVVCLDQVEKELEVQYEYDSEESKNQVEGFLRSASGASRAKEALEESQQARTTVQSDLPVLTRSFRTPQAFVKTFLSSIDQGFIRVKNREPIPPGTQVRLFLTIQDGASRRKAFCEGIVKSARGGETVLDLHGSEGPLKERLQRLCQKIIDEKAQTEWKGREASLREASYTVEGNIPDWVKVASIAGLLAANAAAYAWIYISLAIPRF